MKHFACAECGETSYDAYMVTDAVWLTAMPSKRGHLHFRCLEKRLGRHLQLEDFTSAPVNEAIRFGFLLAKRTVNLLQAEGVFGPCTPASGPDAHCVPAPAHPKIVTPKTPGFQLLPGDD